MFLTRMTTRSATHACATLRKTPRAFVPCPGVPARGIPAASAILRRRYSVFRSRTRCTRGDGQYQRRSAAPVPRCVPGELLLRARHTRGDPPDCLRPRAPGRWRWGDAGAPTGPNTVHEQCQRRSAASMPRCAPGNLYRGRATPAALHLTGTSRLWSARPRSITHRACPALVRLTAHMHGAGRPIQAVTVRAGASHRLRPMPGDAVGARGTLEQGGGRPAVRPRAAQRLRPLICARAAHFRRVWCLPVRISRSFEFPRPPPDQAHRPG